MKTFNINRRRFLQTSAASFALSVLGANAMHLIHPSKPYRVALIGTGWYGKSDLLRLMQVVPVEVIALCDVDKEMLKHASELISQRIKTNKTPKLYNDYKKLLSENELDIVLIGTPDHWHPLQMIDAVKAGVHVYVQKPISVDVMEGEAMVAAARKYNKVVQVGTQRKSTPHILEAKKNIVEAGKLGKIKHVEMCCYYHMRSKSNPEVIAVPDYFDYDAWTGPAPMLPFTGLPHRGGWRAQKEYSNGILGDMCVHMLDTARWLLQLGWPKKISSVGGIYVDKLSKANIPDTQTAVFEFDELNCIWQHRSWGTAPDPQYPWALFVYGENGTLKISPMSYDFIPEDKEIIGIHKDVLYEKEKFPEDVTEKAIELHAAPATRYHMLDFISAIENKTKPVADIYEGHISTASCILANISLELGRPLKYDPIKKIVINDKQATAMLSRKYRSPYQHPNFKIV